MGKTEDLRERINKEMVTDHVEALERSFEVVKEIIRISPNGIIEVLNKDAYTTNNQILLYLIGKLYAFKGGLTKSEFVDNNELGSELGMLGGTLRPALKRLREASVIQTKKEGKIVKSAIKLDRLEKVVTAVTTKPKE